jgi:hypothetical protein
MLHDSLAVASVCYPSEFVKCHRKPPVVFVDLVDLSGVVARRRLGVAFTVLVGAAVAEGGEQGVVTTTATDFRYLKQRNETLEIHALS